MGTDEQPLMFRYQSCFEWGLQDPYVTIQAGELLPRLSTLTANAAVYLCCTILRVASTGRYPASCSVKLGLSSYFHRSHSVRSELFA